jgi:hypothetical protein
MDEGVASGERGAEIFGLAEIAGDGFAGDAGEGFEAAGTACEKAEVRSGRSVLPGDMGAYEAGCSCNEDSH